MRYLKVKYIIHIGDFKVCPIHLFKVKDDSLDKTQAARKGAILIYNAIENEKGLLVAGTIGLHGSDYAGEIRIDVMVSQFIISHTFDAFEHLLGFTVIE